MTAPAPPRTAPPYRLVLRADAPRAEWLAARRKGIGSSDIPQILGVSEYGSAQHVYYDKRGELPERDEISEAAFWGQRHEETVARVWAERERTSGRRIGLVARKDPGMGHHMCTLDRRVDECPFDRTLRAACALEIKCRNAFVANKWKREVPDDVLAQALWQIHVTGYDHIHVACLIGGSDFRRYVVRRGGNEQIIGDIVTAADRLWRDIALGHVPPLTGEEPAGAMLDLYDTLYPDRAGFANLDEYPALSVAAIGELYAYEVGRLTAKAGERRKDAAKVAMVEMLGPHRMAILNGDAAYELREYPGRERCDFTLLAERYPEAYAECVSRKPYDQLVIAREHRLSELPGNGKKED